MSADPDVAGREIERLRQLAKVAALTLRGDAAQHEILAAAAAAAAIGCGGEAAFVAFHGRQPGELVVQAASPKAAFKLGTRITVNDHPAAGRALATDAACTVGAVRTEQPGGLVAADKDLAPGSAAAAAIRTDASTLGVIEVHGAAAAQFGPADVAFLDGVAEIVSALLTRRNVEHMARNSAANAMVLAAEREVFAAELEHRVANHLQQILLALRLEQRRADDEAARLAFGRIADRVGATLSLNQALRRPIVDGDSGRLVAMAGFLQTLARDLMHPTVQIDVVCDDDFSLPLGRAIIVGRLVNEVVLNAIKHAFAGRPSGRVSITLLGPDKDSNCTLVISDNGTGLKKGRPGSQGLALIAALARQLDASITQDATPLTGGTRYRLQIPCGSGQASDDAPAARARQ